MIPLTMLMNDYGPCRLPELPRFCAILDSFVTVFLKFCFVPSVTAAKLRKL